MKLLRMVAKPNVWSSDLKWAFLSVYLLYLPFLVDAKYFPSDILTELADVFELCAVEQ